MKFLDRVSCEIKPDRPRLNSVRAFQRLLLMSSHHSHTYTHMHALHTCTRSCMHEQNTQTCMQSTPMDTWAKLTSQVGLWLQSVTCLSPSAKSVTHTHAHTHTHTHTRARMQKHTHFLPSCLPNCLTKAFT